LIGRVLTNSTNALILLLFFVSIGSLLCGSLMFYCEKGIWDFKQGAYIRDDIIGLVGKEPSPFYSIGRSLWWVVVTMTTVGYGDYYPTSTQGKCVGAATCCMSVLLMALPITIIGNEFTEQYAIEQKMNEASAARSKGRRRSTKQQLEMLIDLETPRTTMTVTEDRDDEVDAGTPTNQNQEKEEEEEEEGEGCVIQ